MPQVIWTKLLGTSSADSAESITTGSDGAIYVAGYTDGNLDGQVNSGDGDAFVTKYNTDGTKAWTKLLGTSSLDEAYSLTTGSDGAIYVAGYTVGNLDGQVNSGIRDAFVTKYNTDGTKAWTKLLGTSGNDYANSLTTGSDGAIYVAGYTYGNLDGQVNSGRYDTFVTKYNTDGTKAWTKLLGVSGNDWASSLTTGSDGAIYVAGYTYGNLDGQVNSGSSDAFVTKYNTDGTKAWTKLLGSSDYDWASSLTTGSDGAIYVAGYTGGNLDGQVNSGGVDSFVTKYNTDGTKAWTKLLGGSSYDQANSLTTGSDGAIYVAGYTYGNLDGQVNSGGADTFVTKYNTDGTKAWTKLLGSSVDDIAMSLTTGSDGAIYVAGFTYSNLDGQVNSGGVDAFVTKYNTDGTKVWTKLLGSSVNDYAYSLTTGSDGAIYVAGYTSGNLNGQVNSGSYDAFVIKLNVNEAPVITSPATATFAENGTGTVYTVTATSTSTNLTYSLSGTDVNLFNINNGVVTFKTAPNFEVPGDNGANNVYDINVIASDGSLTATKAVAITVTNVNEAPVITSAATATFAENGTGTVYTVTATDVDAGTTLTYSLSGTDANLFNINNGVVTFKTAPNFEVPGDNGANNVYDINVIASDGTLTATQAVAITVTNVTEPSVIWTKLLGTSSYDWVSSLTTGSDGAIYVAGVTGGNLDGQVNSGSYDGFVTKYNTDGTKAWTKLLGGSSYDYANSLTTGSDGAIYVAGYTGGNLDGQVNSGNEDAFVTKYNTDGTKAWTKLLGGSSYDIAMSLTTGSDGAIYVAGYTDGNLDGQVNSGNNDAFVTKYNTDGTKAWTKLLGGSGADYANSLTTGSDGAIYVAGYTATNLNGQVHSGSYDGFVVKLNVNEAPVITSAATATFAENGTGTVYTVTATSTSTNLTYSLSGTDVNLFNINNGVVTFKTAPNFEVPGDNGANNVYDINVIASDGSLTATQAVVITVTDVNDIVQSSVSYTLNSSETDLALIGTANIDGTGNSLNNAIFGNSGNNVLDGRAGADSLFGNAGDDTLIGGLGADTMTGGIGNDWYWVDDAGDSVIEYANEGTDKVFTSISYTLTANVEDLALQEIAANINGTGNILNNTITDNSKDNILDGGAGNDIIRASGGNDTLIGGIGADTLTGGLGNDRFVYTNLTDSLLGGIDIIKDFNNSTDTDRFVVSAARSVFNNVGVVSGLNATAIGSKLTTSNFGANAAALFTIGSKSYVAINDSIAGFNALSDAIVDITGYKGTLSAGSFVTA
ncbi:SBBP repeat-containing protein [Aphanizomenon flos-aquae FACHB-1416]|uniref:beta strand repeat-containing protein n=1 Tax=Aphanizomenon flos-aquae TaxID=1176 RepID=UPI0016895EFB|nr:SBBP repeat-containing protein [Aphanizomenon flos-aquae]MBD2674711.1 SBBP repeat-containing protein [Aphanizomenon flos-aquae FACHB-1416]